MQLNMSENRELRMISRFLSTIFAAHIMILLIGCDQNIVTKSDIIYQSIGDVELSLDLYLSEPQADTLQPAILLVHGGGWRKGNKRDMEQVAMMLAKRGYVAISELPICSRLALPSSIKGRTNSGTMGANTRR